MEEPLNNSLKMTGHSPAKAAEIVLDVRRGDPHALAWIASLGFRQDADERWAKPKERTE